jgi:PAS domain S-box-containing protein
MDRLDPLFERFLESAPDAAVVVDQRGRIVGVNRLAEEMFDHRRDELIGEGIELLVPERFREQHLRERQAYAGAPRTRPMGRGLELWGRRKSGKEFPAQISLSPLETEGGAVVISIIRDMTAQRAAEARFRGLLESAPDGIIVADEQGKIVIVNSQTERLFGYERDELIGEAAEKLVPALPRDVQASPNPRPRGAGEQLTARTRDGREFPAEVSLSPLVTDEGTLVISIVRDITERRRAEEMVRASLREKEALLREIHHRVKNNLQVTTSLLRLQAASVGDPRVAEIFSEAEDRIRSMALVHEKLYQSTNLSRIDLGDYIKSLGDLLIRSSAIARANVTLDVGGSQVFLGIDTAVPCGLIVNELLSNALKHAFPGSRPGRVAVHVDRLNGDVSIRIDDDGVGLPVTFDAAQTGTLGMKLLQALVQQIDGEVTIESPGRGTSVKVTFPAERGR